MLLRDFVNKKIASADKEASAEGVPLTLNNCKKYKKMRDLKVYGNCFQDGTPTPENPIEVQCVGELVTDESDVNYGKYRVPIICRGKNYFSMKKAKLPQQTINGITFTPLDDERIHVTGKMITSSYTKYAVDYAAISIKAGQYRGKGYSNWDFNYGVYSGGGFLTNIKQNGGNVSKDGYLLNIYIGIPASVTQELDVIIELQVEKSTFVSSYEPYVEPVATNIYLDEPLRSDDKGRFVDCLDLKNDKVLRNVYEQTILSTSGGLAKSDWYISIGWNCYMLPLDCAPNFQQYSMKELCSHFCKNLSHTSANIVAWSFQITKASVYFFTTPLNDETVTDFKNLLAEKEAEGNPVKLYYVLETPIEEPLNIELPKLNAKTTIIEVDTGMAPSNISAKYIKR